LSLKRKRKQKKGKGRNLAAVNLCLLSGAERRQTAIFCHDPEDGVIPHLPLQVSNNINTRGAVEQIVG
jgi:hypothetical protein